MYRFLSVDYLEVSLPDTKSEIWVRILTEIVCFKPNTVTLFPVVFSIFRNSRWSFFKEKVFLKNLL